MVFDLLEELLRLSSRSLATIWLYETSFNLAQETNSDLTRGDDSNLTQGIEGVKL